MRMFARFLAGLLALAVAPHVRADVDKRVGSGAGCQYATVQAAINAASNADGVTNIKIARNAVYSAQQLNITSKNVRLIGGFADCVQASPDSTRTVLNGAGGSANTVISVLGSTSVVAFYHLDITGGDEVTTNSGFGGGVAIGGGPHALVYFEDAYIHDNNAGYGGGVWVRNEHSSDANDVNVQFGDGVRLDSNYGAYGGGGLWCSNAKVLFTGANSYIARNRTAGTVNSVAINGAGGGIRAENCSLWLGATSVLGTLSQNTAGGNGGGLSISGERAHAWLYTRTANRPPAILLNTAGGVGGGIDIGSSAIVQGYDVVIADNTAHGGGGGVSLFDNDAPPDARLILQGTLQGAPNDPSGAGVAVNCNAALRCNRIGDNQAVGTGGNNLPAAALRLSADASIGDNAGVTVALNGTELSGNQGESLLRAYTGGTIVSTLTYLTGTLIVDNQVSGNLLHQPADGFLGILHATIAGNAVGAADVIRTHDAFSLRSSIVWQPGKRALNDIDGSPTAAKVDYLLASDLLGIPASTHNLIADPLFENAGGADYRLRATSPGLDYAPRLADQNGGEPATADHAPRPVDLASVPDEFGSYDLGAYERAFVCAADTLFCSGFEP